MSQPRDQDCLAKAVPILSEDVLLALCLRYQERLEELRTRVAKQLHDDLAQAMTVAALELSLLVNSLRSEREVSQSEIEGKIKEISQILSGMIRSVRELKEELRPKTLDEFGLVAVLQSLCAETEKRTGLVCRLQAQPKDVILSVKNATELYRMSQEIVANVERHANASRIEMSVIQDMHKTVFIIRDDGRGITEAELRCRKGLGIQDLRLRAECIGATLKIIGQPEKGTTVTIQLPTA